MPEQTDSATAAAERFWNRYEIPFEHETAIKVRRSGLLRGSSGTGHARDTVVHLHVKEAFTDGRLSRSDDSWLCENDSYVPTDGREERFVEDGEEYVPPVTCETCLDRMERWKTAVTDGGVDQDDRSVPEQIRDTIEASDYPELTVREVTQRTGLTEQQVYSAAGSMDRLELDRRVDVVRLPEDDGVEFVDDPEHELVTDGGRVEEDGDVDRSPGSSDWEYQTGQTLVDDSEGPDFDISNAPLDHEPTEYTVKRRLSDADEVLRFYYLEWERETAGGPSIENRLLNADLVRLHYSAIDTEADDGE